MGQWTLLNILFLLLLSKSNGLMEDRRHWRERFRPFEEYIRVHEGHDPLKEVSDTPRFTLLAPDLLRTDIPVNIYLQADNVPSAITVTISIMDFTKTNMLLRDSARLGPENNFHTLKPIQLSSDRLGRDETRDKFVNMRVTFGGYYAEDRVVMVSFQSGYIFIQTDKPVYNPGDKVHYRAFVSSPSFKAFEGTITVDIQNPEGVVIKQVSRVKAIGGVFPDTFVLSEYVSEGTWTLIVKFDHWTQNTFSSTFEVKKHVLPAFNVTLTPRKSFLDLQDTELAVEISARYLYGKVVQGTAYVVFGVKMNDQMTRLPSMKQVTNLDGGVVTLTMEEIRRAYPNIRSLVGNSVYVKASVLTKTGSDLVEAEKSGIKIVESPYVITFTDTAKYFKPGLPFDLAIQVSQHDGSPAHNVKVKVNLQDAPLIVSSGSTRTTINMPSDQRPQTITVETNQDGLRPEQQARQHITIQPYFAYNQRRRNYLYISAGSNKVSVGETLSLKLTINTADERHRAFIKQITYLVINKGEIVTGKLQDVTGQTVTSITFTVTTDLMPSFRVVAFYTIPWAGLGEVVSDSIWMDVVDSCVGGLKVGPVGDRHEDYAPGESFDLQIKGDPEARVSLVVVDNAVFLLKKDRLTQNKLWNTVEQGDIGCTHGGGRDAKGVFKDAGLLFASNDGVKTIPRQDLQCPGSARRRRSAELLQRKAQLENHYKEKLKQRCCKDGLREIRMPYSCTRRSLYITEGRDCILAFRYCCATYRNQVYDTALPTTPPPPTVTAAPDPPIYGFGRASGMDFGSSGVAARDFDPRRVAARDFDLPVRYGMRETPRRPIVPYSREVMVQPVEMPVQQAPEEDDDLVFQDEDDLYVRSKFFESWLWTDVKLPSKTDSDGFASMTMTKSFPDSITEWGVLAVSGSPNTGFCVAEPYNVRAWKRFFVDLRLPYSVARNEQVEIKAVIHNYDTSDLNVRVILSKTEGMCSVAFKTKHTQQVQVQAGSSVAVTYTIVPLVVGKPALEVIVLAADERGGDRIRKTLRVVMEGVQKTEVVTMVLDPSAHGGSHTVRIRPTELESVVPNSSPETFMSVRGNLLADSIDNSISDDSLALLIRMPGGCVEQNLARMTLPLIATLYLDRTHTWQSVGVQRRDEAIKYIGRGYENQLVYKKKDGSYPPYRREGASTWITAYVVKVFSMAYTIIGVDKQQVCDPLLFLLQHKYQAFPGNFVESNPVYSTTMTGGHKGDDPDITLTAFVHIALAEARQAGIQCNHPGKSLEEIMTKTAGYLTRSLSRAGRRPYTVAIASYALALTRPSTPPNVLLRAAAAGGTHWPDRQSQFFTLEATGYALLALVKMGRIQEAAAPFNWLNSQRRRGGGFGPTQSTMVVLHALSEYLIKRPSPDDVSLDVDISITGRRDISAHFDTGTAYVARTSKLPPKAELQVKARGNGQGIVEVLTHYNQMPEVDEKKPCPHFELSVAIEESSEAPPADAIKTYQITIKVRALGPRDVRMVVLDISLPTGFTPENSDLELLSNTVDKYINNFQIVDNLSDRGSLIIHVFKVAHKEPDILMFRLQQRFKVGLLQPSSVTVYEYYDPDRRCTRSYSPKEDKEELKRICTDNVCRCTQGDCCISQPDNEDFSDKERETFACKSLHHVLKVKVLNVSHSYYDKYEMEITQVIKLGEEAGIRAGQRRYFMSHGVCSDGLNLKPGSHYLIIGPKDDQWKVDTETNGYIYMLGKDTWVELWPSPTDCSKPNLQTKCKNLNDAANELSSEGCRL